MDNYDFFDINPEADYVATEGRVPPNVRTPDLPASVEAGANAEWPAKSLRKSLLWHIKAMQPVTAIELEEFVMFSKLNPSTVRKRVSELKEIGKIFPGEVVDFTDKNGKVRRATAWWTTPQDAQR